MKHLLLILFLAIATIGTAQQKVTTDSLTGNLVSIVQIEQRDSTTGKTFVDSKGKQYDVFISKTGKSYIMRQSKKTGKFYRSYLLIQ